MLLIGDDQGYRDFGFMGSQGVRTPSLDALAEQGVVFEAAFVPSSECKRSLRTLLTGLEPLQWSALRRRLGGREGPSAGELIERLPTLPRLLREAGYRTFQGGKLWDTSFAGAGFDAGTAVAHDPRRGLPDGGAFGRSTLEPLLRFLNEVGPGARSGEVPFFLWLAPPLPHLPHDAPASLRQPYLEAGLPAHRAAYYASCTRFDRFVGDVLAALEERDLAGRTLVVFLVDNGWESEVPRRDGLGGARGKLSMHEPGFRTPLLVHGPGIRPRRLHDLVSSPDAVATLLDYAGARRPPLLTGRSLRAALEGGAVPGRALVAGRMERARRPADARWRPGALGADPAFFARDASWWLLWFRSPRLVRLYPAGAPADSRDVAAAHPSEVERLQRSVEAWEAELRSSVEAVSVETLLAPATPATSE